MTSLVCEDTKALVLGRYQVKSKQMPAFWRINAEKSRVICQDGAFSIPLPDQTALWLFGDTFLGTFVGERPEFEGAVSNSVCRVSNISTQPTAEYLVNAKGRADFVVPLQAPESWEKHRIWPCTGIHIDGSTYLFYERIEITGNTMWSFQGVGVGLAIAQGNSWNFQRVCIPETASEVPIVPQSAVIYGKDCLLYFLSKIDAYTSAVFLSKVPITSLADPKAYQFWKGGCDFSSSKAEAAYLVMDVYGQVSVAYNPYLDQFVMFHVGHPALHPRSIFIRTAKHPFGPWSEPVLVFSLPGELGKDLVGLFYCAYLHPELFRENGRVMAITYCIVDTNPQNPALVEIELTPP